MTPEEYAVLKQRAGIASIGGYIKSVVFGNGAEDQNRADVPRIERVHPVERGLVAEVGNVSIAEKPKAGIRACVHGVAKGWHCWQCRGVAVV